MIFLILLVLLIIVMYTNNKKIINIFWTGGYDSTYLICKYLLIENSIVQPIYIKEKIDNCKKCLFYRKNRQQELNTMKNIRRMIKNKYPSKYTYLLPTIFVNNVPKNNNLRVKIKNMSIFKREYNQYEAMSRYSHYIKKPICLGIIKNVYKNGKIKLKDSWYKFFKKRESTDYKSHPFYYFRFPIAKYTKSNLMNIAKKNNFDDILKITWSCWFPINNIPCGKCPMCKERII